MFASGQTAFGSDILAIRPFRSPCETGHSGEALDDAAHAGSLKGRTIQYMQFKSIEIAGHTVGIARSLSLSNTEGILRNSRTRAAKECFAVRASGGKRDSRVLEQTQALARNVPCLRCVFQLLVRVQ